MFCHSLCVQLREMMASERASAEALPRGIRSEGGSGFGMQPTYLDGYRSVGGVGGGGGGAGGQQGFIKLPSRSLELPTEAQSSRPWAPEMSASGLLAADPSQPADPQQASRSDGDDSFRPYLLQTR